MNSNITNFIQNYKSSIVITIILMINSFYIIGQESLEGQRYLAITSESCKSKGDGGCWIVGYRVLEFEKDSVSVYNKVSGHCYPESDMYDKDFINLKKFKWYKKEGQIHITGFDKFRISITREGKLRSNINNEEGQYFEFLIEKK